MDRRVYRGILIIFISIMLIGVVAAEGSQGNQTCNNQTMLNQIKELKNQIEMLKTKNLKLEAENQKLQMQLSSKSEWDARTLMDKLFIFTLTPSGKQYKLLFHEGGLGGVTVYQYVGVWQGDAGKWRQYKQIAFFKGTQAGEGFIKPGIVIRPVWGFNGSKEVRINSIGELIKWEKKYNSIEGLAEYYKWMFDRYIEASKYAAIKVVFIIVIALMFGVVLGETKHPIKRFLDLVTIRRVSSFRLTPESGERRKRRWLPFRR